jgi:hypothetical protein
VPFLLLQQLVPFFFSVVEDSQTMMVLCSNEIDNLKIEICASAEEVLDVRSGKGGVDPIYINE